MTMILFLATFRIFYYREVSCDTLHPLVCIPVAFPLKQLSMKEPCSLQ